MCKIIEFDAFLGVILEKRPKIEFRTLRKMIEQFESTSVVVDFSSKTVASALSHYPNIFEISRENKCYSRAAHFDSNFVKEEFEAVIPEDIKKRIDMILSEKRNEYVGL